MPRISGVSATTTVWLMRRRPRPRTVARWRWIWPKGLFTSVTFTFLAGAFFAMAVSARDLGNCLAALGCDALRRRHARQRIHRRTHHVDRIARAVALREHVAHAG